MYFSGRYRPYLANGVLEVSGTPDIRSLGGVKIYFGGRITNAESIRRRLLRLGCCFAGNSDSELLLRGYIALGSDIFDMVEGDCTAAVFNSSKNRLHLIALSCNSFFIKGGEGEITFSNSPEFSSDTAYVLRPYELLTAGPESSSSRILKYLGSGVSLSEIKSYFETLSQRGFVGRAMHIDIDREADRQELFTALAQNKVKLKGGESFISSLAKYRREARAMSLEMYRRGIECEFPILSLHCADAAYTLGVGFRDYCASFSGSELYCRKIHPH
jgi:hypothetical protein